MVILADPVAHVRTPEALNARMSEAGIDAVMVPAEVAPGDLAATVEGLRSIRNLAGLVVTVPHKTAMPALCDSLSQRAEIASSVNVVRRGADGRLHGDLLDGEGFMRGLSSTGTEISGKRIFLAGAGGAASAIAFSLAARGPACLTVANRSRAKAQDLVTRLTRAFPGLEAAVGDGPTGHDLAINGTSLGLKPEDPLPFEPAELLAGATVAEVIMQPETTALLDRAQELGLGTHAGRHMLDGQLAEMMDFLLTSGDPQI
nr:shikimate dehydrogenase [Salipiger mangrovisoli]